MEIDESSTDNTHLYRPFLQSLSLNESKKGTASTEEKYTDLTITNCLLCDEKFNIIDNKKEFLAHLIMSHKLVISDVNSIPEFDKSVFLSYL